MSGGSSLGKRIMLTVGSIDTNEEKALKDLDMYLNQNDANAFRYVLKYLIEDIMFIPSKMGGMKKSKIVYLNYVLNILFKDRERSEVIVRTVFESVEIPNEGGGFVPAFLSRCSIPLEISLWICMCNKDSSKLDIRKDALEYISTVFPRVNDSKLGIPKDIIDGCKHVIMIRSNSSSSSAMMLNPVAVRIGQVIGTIGCVVSTVPEALQQAFCVGSEAALSRFQYRDIMTVLITIANKEEERTHVTPAKMQFSLSLQTKEDVKIIQNMYPVLVRNATTEWNYVNIINQVLQAFPSINVNDIFYAMDDPSLILQGSIAASFISKLFYSYKKQYLPSEFVFRLWHCIDRQIDFIRFILDAGEETYDMRKTTNQIIIPEYVSVSSYSCWFSRDLISMILLLYARNRGIRDIIHNNTVSIQDALLLWIGIVQVKEPWTLSRLELLGLLIINIVSETKDKSPFKKEVEGMVRIGLSYFFTFSPSNCVQCIINVYAMTMKSDPYLFNYLHNCCIALPSLIQMMMEIPIEPSLPNLKMIIHLFFLEGKRLKDLKMVDVLLQGLLKENPISVTKMLLLVLSEYSEDMFNIIDSLEAADIVINVLQYSLEVIIHDPNHPLSKHFISVMHVIEEKMNSGEGLRKENVISRMVNSMLNEYMSVYDKDMNTYMEKLKDMCYSQENRVIIIEMVDSIVSDLVSIEKITPSKRSRMVALIEFGFSNRVVMEDTTDRILAFLLKVYSAPQYHTSINVEFSRELVLRTSQFLKSIPSFVNSLLETPFFEQDNPESARVLRGEDNLVSKKSIGSPQLVSSSPLMSNSSKDSVSSVSSYQQKLFTHIHQALDVIEMPGVTQLPDSLIRTRITIVMNNLTEATVNTKGVELITTIPEGMEDWFADFLVRTRVERQPNYHDLYVKVLAKASEMNRNVIYDRVVAVTIQTIKSILSSSLITLTEQHIVLKNLGSWLGKITIGEDRFLSQLQLNLHQELYIAFYHQHLLYVYSFVCEVLRACKTSTVIKPPFQPWLMSLLSLLKEFKEVPGIKMKITYPLDNLLAYLDCSLSAIPFQPSYLYLAIPSVKGNPDFDEVKQEKVDMFFSSRYEIYRTLPDEFRLHKVYEESAHANEDSRRGDEDAMQVQIHEEDKHLFDPESITSALYLLDQIIAEVSDNFIVNESNNQIRRIVDSALGFYHHECLNLKMDLVVRKMRECLVEMIEEMMHNLLAAIEKDLIWAYYDALLAEDVKLDNTGIYVLVTTNMDVFYKGLKSKLIGYCMDAVMETIGRERKFGKERIDWEDIENSAMNVDISAFVLGEKEIRDLCDSLRFKQVLDIINHILEKESNPKLNWMIEWDKEEDESVLNQLRNEVSLLEIHITKEDDTIYSTFSKVLRDETFYSSYHFMTVFVELASILSQLGYSQFADVLTTTALDVVVEPESYIASFLALLSKHGLFCVPIFDIVVARSFLSYGMNDLPLHYSCLVNLLFTREVLTMDLIPKTVSAYAAVKNTEYVKSAFQTESELCTVEKMMKTMVEKDEDTMVYRDIRGILMKREDYMLNLRKVINEEELDMISLERRINQLIVCIDSICTEHSEESDDPVYGMMSILYESGYSLFLKQQKYESVDRILFVLKKLVKRETSYESREIMMKFIFSTLKSFFFMTYNLDQFEFSPMFYQRVYDGLFKEIILSEVVETQRKSMFLLYCSFLEIYTPITVPSFSLVWISLISNPAFMYYLFSNYTNLIYDTHAVTLYRSLLVFMYSIHFIEKSPINHTYLVAFHTFSDMIFYSFPGFLGSHYTEFYPLVPDDRMIQSMIKTDCPESCNIDLVPPESQEYYLKRALTVYSEPHCVYKDELALFNLLGAVEDIMIDTNAVACMNYILKRLQMLSPFRCNAILRYILIYWVREESTHRLTAVECIHLLLHEIDRNSKQFILTTIVDYIRYPCKETLLFLQVYLRLFNQMDNEWKSIMHDILMIKNKETPHLWGLMVVMKRINSL